MPDGAPESPKGRVLTLSSDPPLYAILSLPTWVPTSHRRKIQAQYLSVLCPTGNRGDIYNKL